MTETDRRTFLKHGVLLSAAAVGGLAHPADAAVGASPMLAPRAAEPLDPALLRALAETVLPESLGADAREAAVGAFERWVLSYEPGFEIDHGYGTSEIRYGPDDPAPAWGVQLRTLDEDARERTGRGFAELAPRERRRLLESGLEAQGRDLPGPARATHVAVGLLAHWTASPGAHDLAYRRRISPRTCRGLDGLGEPPPPLERSPAEPAGASPRRED